MSTPHADAVDLDVVNAWIAADPDPETAAELQALVNEGNTDELADRFGERLTFGTAGIRGRMGGGPARMNRAMIRLVSAGIAEHIVADGGGLVVIGYDGRHKSDVFAADAAAVFAAAGLDVQLFESCVPTPLLAFAGRELDAVAAVMVTASHNPPQDNGYKVYTRGGRQIISPMDEEISARIDAIGAVAEIKLDENSDRITAVSGDVTESYMSSIGALVDDSNPRDITIVYTAMHGVGGELVVRALNEAGFTDVHPVPEQHEPDPNFSTVAFPNPEEDGAMDLAVALAEKVNADLVVANDPDADRIAVGIPINGTVTLLSGDDVGVVLGEDILSRNAMTDGADPVVATTVVSSTLLARVAEHYNAGYTETLTGFKWLAAAAETLATEGKRMVLGYEQALGVSVGDVVRDKDGISAVLVAADLVARLKAEGKTLADVLAEVSARHGAHVTVGSSVLLEDTDGSMVQAALDHLRANPPAELGGSNVVERWDHDAGVMTREDGTIEQIDLPVTALLRFVAEDGTRVMVRPSGTEPKLKFYGEAVVADDPTVARDLAQERAEKVLKAFMGYTMKPEG